MRPLTLVIGMLLALLMLTTHPLLAATRNEDPSEAKVRAIAKELRCAVCQNQSDYESNSDLAKDMLGVIREKVRAGESEAAIRDYFFQRYGDYIYLEPTKKGMNLLLWFAPLVGLLIGAGALFVAIRNWRSSTPSVEHSMTTDSKKGMHSRIEKELQDVEI